jgi:small subunit ribosomal protein S16
MVKIRLRRVGAKNKPMYRIVVADSRSPRDGAFIEIIGHYNPLTDPETLDVDKEKAVKWLTFGARPTETVIRLLAKSEVPMKFQTSKKQKTAKSKSKSKESASASASPSAPTPAAAETSTKEM